MNPETLILHNGLIHTLAAAHPRVTALAIRAGRVLAIGTPEEVRAAVGRTSYEELDLQGRAVVPGLTDAHVHITWYGWSRQQVDLTGCESRAAALERIAVGAERLTGSDSWLQGGNWDHTAWDNRWPTATDLDQVCAEYPVFLVRKDGHSAWVNRRALQLAQIDATTSDPPGGYIQRDEAGNPTGILFETAQRLVRQVIPEPNREDRLSVLQTAMYEALSYGLTSLHIPTGPTNNDSPELLTDLQTLRARGELSVRCLVAIAARDLNKAVELGIRSGLGDEWVRIGGIKIFADGSLGSQTAEMLLSYVDQPANLGLAMLPEAKLRDLVQRANQAGISVMVHAIGDRANRKVLDAIAAARASGLPEPLSLPNRIEHVQLIDLADVPRFKALDVVASMQPVHATSDMEMAQALWGERCATAYACRTMLDAGAVLACGSDAPIEALNPWLGIHAAVTRQRRDGTPSSGWYPEQRLSLTEALHGYCSGPAVASGEAGYKGTLAPGSLADLVVLPADPFTLTPAELHTLHADLTLVGGVVRYERAQPTKHS